MSLASAAAVTPNMEKRPIAIMGDGGFWHNGLITGVASNMFNRVLPHPVHVGAAARVSAHVLSRAYAPT